MKLKNRFFAFIICLVMFFGLIPVVNVEAAVTDINIISDTNVTAQEAKKWAESKGATSTFANLAELYFKYASKCGDVNPAIAYVQAAKETGYGKFGGVLDETYHNPCGLKTAQGGDDYDKEAHQRFDSWSEGVQAHMDHLALYAGASGYPKSDTYDPRHFATIKGKAKTVNSLGGRWAPSSTYGEEINKLYRDLLDYSDVELDEEEIVDEDVDDDSDNNQSSNEAPNPGKVESKPALPHINVVIQETILEKNDDEDLDTNITSSIGWKKENGSWYYYKSDNTKATGWIKPDKNWYYLNSNGKMATGWMNINGTWYYLKDSGAMAKGWIKLQNTWYYLKDSGAMATGFQHDGNGLYYLHGSGAMMSDTGWSKLNNKWYYFEPSGKIKIGWLKDNNYWYYLQGDGSMVTGFNEVDNKVYCFNDSGSMKTGWYKFENNWYYFNPDGSAAKGWIKDNGVSYYLYDTYAMAKGWINLNDTWYFLKDSGAMATGWITSNGDTYYLELTTGRMLTNTTIDGYKIGSDGKKQTSSSNSNNNSSNNTNNNTSSNNNTSNSKKTIIVDAGHNYGGDYGAESTVNGVKYIETELNMDVASKLKVELEKRGYNVIMTRLESDKTKESLTESLTNRVNIANQSNGALFVSIHHNTASESAKGVETYYSSNARDSKFDGTIVSNKLSTSKKLAAAINNSIADKIGAVNRGAKDGNLFVCRNTNIPSVLVEVGFITNPEEALRCADSKSQQKVAEAIADAIDSNL